MRTVLLAVMVFSTASLAATLEVKTTDGRTVAGEVVLETERGVLLRTESGNVMVPWVDIASGHSEGTASATPVQAAARSTSSTGPARSGPTLGISGGIGASPLAGNSYPPVWVAAAVAFIVHADLGRLALRFTVPIQAGAITGGYSGSGFKLFAGVEGQLRLQFSDVISSALGLQAGVAVQTSSSSSSSGAAFAFGPTLTPIAVRLGAQRSHELSLAGSVQFSPVSSGVAYAGSLLTVNYAYLF